MYPRWLAWLVPVLRFLLQRPPVAPAHILIRSVTTTEPRWTEQDRGEALALALYRERPCACGCGNPAALTLLPEGVGPDWAIEEVTCTARLALLEKQNAVPESRRKYLPASLWVVRPAKG